MLIRFQLLNDKLLGESKQWEKPIELEGAIKIGPNIAAVHPSVLKSKVQSPESRVQGQSPESRVQSPESRVQSPESRVQQSPESRVQSPESRVQSPESRVQSPESRVQSPESRVQSPESSRVQSPAESRVQQSPESRVQSPESSRVASPAESRVQGQSPGSESRVQSPESRVQSPESRVQSPESRVQSPESRVQSPESRVSHSNVGWGFQIFTSTFQRRRNYLSYPQMCAYKVFTWGITSLPSSFHRTSFFLSNMGFEKVILKKGPAVKRAVKGSNVTVHCTGMYHPRTLVLHGICRSNAQKSIRIVDRRECSGNIHAS